LSVISEVHCIPIQIFASKYGGAQSGFQNDGKQSPASGGSNSAGMANFLCKHIGLIQRLMWSFSRSSNQVPLYISGTVHNCRHYNERTNRTIGYAEARVLYFENIKIRFHFQLKSTFYSVRFRKRGGGPDKADALYARDDVDSCERSLTFFI
jgi:hypothetical protein